MKTVSNKNYKIRKLSYLRNAWPLLALLGFSIIGIRYYNARYDDPFLLYCILGILFLFELVPWTIIHCNYSSINAEDSFYYDSDRNEMIFTHKNEDKIIFSINDIEKIQKFISRPHGYRDFGLLMWDHYHHTIVDLNNGYRIIITSLLVPNLDIPVDQNKIEVHKSMFRYAKGTSLQNRNSIASTLN